MFPNGLPGAGLLLLRLVCGGLVIGEGVIAIIAAPDVQTLLLQAVAFAAALLILAGLWTPMAGLLVVFVEAWFALSRTNSIANSVLLATIGAALAALGPGAHSLDAKIYGRKRIQVQDD